MSDGTNSAGGVVGAAGAAGDDKSAGDKGAAEKGTVQASGQAADKGAAKGDAGAAADKGAGDKAAADIELKLPKGFTADEKALGSFKAIAKELGLDSAKAQKLFDLYPALEQQRMASAEAAADAQDKSWEQELKDDKEFGGKNYQASTVLITKGLKHFDGDRAFREVITNAGLGSNPVVCKFLRKLGAAVGEDKVGAGAAGGEVSKPTREQELRDRFPKSYDSMNGKRAD